MSVVIPALNERQNLDLLLPALKEELSRLGIRWEIVISDGGSTDGGPDIARSRGARVVRQTERGYGGALIAGFAAARGAYILTMDADLSHRPVVAEQLWAHRSQADMLIASRYVPGGKAAMGKFRYVLSRILNETFRRLLCVPVMDQSSGFRLYRREAVRDLVLESRDFDVLEEILLRVHSNGWSVGEVPFEYMSRGSGNSHARLVQFAGAYLKTLARMWSLRNSIEAADYDYRGYDSRILLQRYWQRRRHAIVTQFASGSQRVLDAGCGSSRIVVDMVDSIGLDIRFNKLRWLKPHHSRLLQGDTLALPFANECFDTVISSQVVEQLLQPETAFAEFWRVLKPGGLLILGTPDNSKPLWWFLRWAYGKLLPHAYAPYQISRFTREALEQRLRHWNYEIIDCRYVGGCEMIFKLRKRGNS